MVVTLYLIGLVIYFIPWLVACFREQPSSLGVFMLNLFLGWTFIGWVVALVWACSGSTKGVVTVQNSGSFTDELQKLISLKEQGALTEEEFNEQKLALRRRT